MDAKDIQQRITNLRLQKGVSELKMSRDLGHSDGYIHHIAAGHSLPSMQDFLYICEYFGITVRDFFDEENDNPILTNELMSLARCMKDDDLEALILVARRLREQDR